ncbi:cyclic nucleotide-binding domain-containing protein [Desulfovibrio sulfodismutans]|uniref:Cyclic nucleotide-binding domain-containing protein n=1 Tax=Desulfolutivibrio sulfodismutans TaxID=63561 RepID=A0A7K3NP68_9BACT|nr:cyclic nucleotide-binding domain-containing protein [Desulfolutivibrio sulfodismutans]NDY57633.1 cyclic nucleotide-binding domain-containing protein [Desulfolutivibrio sulfodismutans]QLA14054.1 cyclic nucleotide-binding domain-containing protein [Desulfolutivibrio sulfodismutans DSM 3696]
MTTQEHESSEPDDGDDLDLADIVREIPAFHGLDEQDITRLLDASEILQVASGETIIRENQSDRHLYFLIDGQVGIHKENVKLCELRRLGDFFGEISVIDSKCRSATVTAKRDCLLLRLDMDAVDMNDMQGQSHVLAVIYRAFSEVLADRLRRMNDELLYLRREVIRLHGRLRYDKEGGRA